MTSYRSLALVTVVLCTTGISPSAETQTAPPVPQGSPYLFVWAGDAARRSPDFLAVIDANPTSPSYGRIISSAPVGTTATMPHHTEYEFPHSNILFANGWVAGRTFIFDLSQPLKPRLASQFTDRAGYSFPHSFVRLPNGHVLGTFQSHGKGFAPGGGLVELEVSRLTLDTRFPMPHWLAADRKGDRLVVTGDNQSWVVVARFDPGKGALSIDQTFRDPGSTVPGISFDRQQWPHGKAGRAIVHGALFGPQ